jgi:hypothetical protein
MIKKSTMAPIFGRVCAAHRLPTVLVLDLDSSGSEPPMLMKLSSHLQQLSQHIIDVVPQPAHNSQSVARSVERAIAASHATTRWACKATGDAADLVRLPGARGADHREIVGAVQGKFGNQCLKGLRRIFLHNIYLRGDIC